MSSLIKGKFVYMKFKDYINKKTIRKLILKSILICVSVNDIRYTLYNSLYIVQLHVIYMYYKSL
jgi:hypothetical protein